MEKIRYKTISPQSLGGLNTVRYAPDEVPTALAESVARHGVLMPVWVTADEKQVICGVRRLNAARLCGRDSVPALVMQESLSARELFLLAVASNWGGDWSDLDRTVCLSKAVAEYALTEEDIHSTLLPALGLEPRKHRIDDYLDTAKLAPALLRAVHEGKLSFRGLRALGRFSPSEQSFFAGSVAAHAALTAQECLQAADWMQTLCRQSGQTLPETLRQTGALAILEHAVWDPRVKAEKFCGVLREKALPSVAAHEKRFTERLQEAPEFSGDFRLEAPAFFEEQGFQLRAKIKKREDLERFRTLLDRRSDWLNSLFDFML